MEIIRYPQTIILRIHPIIVGMLQKGTPRPQTRFVLREPTAARETLTVETRLMNAKLREDAKRMM